MKFDITRAWKDEAYRQALSEEELHLLPTNPAGELELADDELDTVSGGFGGVGGFGGFGGIGGFGGTFISNRENSVAVICEINIFSINIANIAVLGAVNNICTNVN
jgi:mersacidin/lichenicidin family type 2 lantibiotic